MMYTTRDVEVMLRALRLGVLAEAADAIDGCGKERQPAAFYAAVVRNLMDTSNATSNETPKEKT